MMVASPGLLSMSPARTSGAGMLSVSRNSTLCCGANTCTCSRRQTQHCPKAFVTLHDLLAILTEAGIVARALSTWYDSKLREGASQGKAGLEIGESGEGGRGGGGGERRGCERRTGLSKGACFSVLHTMQVVAASCCQDTSYLLKQPYITEAWIEGV